MITRIMMAMQITPPTIDPIKAPDDCWVTTVLFIPEFGIKTRLGAPTVVVYVEDVGTYTDA